ncbi:MAG: hypothetical protein LUC26_03405 [Prevotella sp.]|nr:hypothetical protein [Prevotella sp.]
MQPLEIFDANDGALITIDYGALITIDLLAALGKRNKFHCTRWQKRSASNSLKRKKAEGRKAPGYGYCPVIAGYPVFNPMRQ